MIFLFIHLEDVGAEDNRILFSSIDEKNVSISEPKITIDGKIQDKMEWNSSSNIEEFETNITDPMTFLPAEYNITIQGWTNTTTIFLLTRVHGESNFDGGLFIRYNLISDTDNIDSLLLNREIKSDNGNRQFKDQFTNDRIQNYVDDIEENGTIDGFGKISFSNGTEIFELSHPLCSNDHLHDVCINTNDTIGFEFDIKSIYINKTENTLIPEENCWISFSIDELMKGNGIHQMCLISGLTLIFPSVFSVAETLVQDFTTDERKHCLKNSPQEKIISFFDGPTEGSFIELIKKTSDKCFLQILKGLEKDEVCGIINLMKEYQLSDILINNSRGIYDIIKGNPTETNETLYQPSTNLIKNIDEICN